MGIIKAITYETLTYFLPLSHKFYLKLTNVKCKKNFKPFLIFHSKLISDIYKLTTYNYLGTGIIDTYDYIVGSLLNTPIGEVRHCFNI